MNIIQNPLTLQGNPNYIDYLKTTLGNANILYNQVLDTTYNPDYQGCLILISLPTDRDEELEHLSINEWNMGDDSFTINKMGNGYYLIDICQ